MIIHVQGPGVVLRAGVLVMRDKDELSVERNIGCVQGSDDAGWEPGGTAGLRKRRICSGGGTLSGAVVGIAAHKRLEPAPRNGLGRDNLELLTSCGMHERRGGVFTAGQISRSSDEKKYFAVRFVLTRR